MNEKIVRLQSLARGLLARRKLQKLRTQDLAMRCIQKNVKKFLLVRGWPWWRLLVKVTPLLNVHRTEEQLRARTDELEVMRARLEKVEAERSEYKEGHDRIVLYFRAYEAKTFLKMILMWKLKLSTNVEFKPFKFFRSATAYL